MPRIRVPVRSSQPRDDVGVDRQVGDAPCACRRPSGPPRGSPGADRRRARPASRHDAVKPPRERRPTAGTLCGGLGVCCHGPAATMRGPAIALTGTTAIESSENCALRFATFRSMPASAVAGLRPISIADVSANCWTLSDEVVEALVEHVGRDVRVEHERPPTSAKTTTSTTGNDARGRRTTGSACAARARAAGGGCARS